VRLTGCGYPGTQPSGSRLIVASVPEVPWAAISRPVLHLSYASVGGVVIANVPPAVVRTVRTVISA